MVSLFLCNYVVISCISEMRRLDMFLTDLVEVWGKVFLVLISDMSSDFTFGNLEIFAIRKHMRC